MTGDRWPSPRANALDSGYNRGYTSAMKTAISIPDSIFQAAETTARRLSMSRSELYSKAVQDFVAAHCHADVTEKLNQVYSKNQSGLDLALSEMQGLSLDNAPW